MVPRIGRLSTLPSTARDYVRLSGSLFFNITHQLAMVLATRGCRGSSDKPESRVSPCGANCLPRHLEPRLCGNGGTARRHVRAVFGHQGHEGLQGFVPKRGACPPSIIFDYIDHLALTQGFTYLNNLKYSLTPLAFAMLACLPSLFVNARVCSKPSTGAQPRNEPSSKGKQKLGRNFFFGPRRGEGEGRGAGRCAG